MTRTSRRMIWKTRRNLGALRQEVEGRGSPSDSRPIVEKAYYWCQDTLEALVHGSELRTGSPVPGAGIRPLGSCRASRAGSWCLRILHASCSDESSSLGTGEPVSKAPWDPNWDPKLPETGGSFSDRRTYNHQATYPYPS